MKRAISCFVGATVISVVCTACCPKAQNRHLHDGSTKSAEGAASPVDSSPQAAADTAPHASAPQATGPKAVSFADDLAFLKQQGEVITLSTPSGGVVALSAKYQGRVMTSAVQPGGRSLGYINRDFIVAGKTGTPFDNYGGEDRFWLGPEGGQFALHFPPGKPFKFEHWQTPAAFQQGQWEVTERTEARVQFERSMKLTNYSGSVFEMSVKRLVRPLDAPAVAELLGDSPPSLDGLSWVGFETVNSVKNVGMTAWTEKTGAPSIWILAMYNPSPDTWVIVPYDSKGDGEVVNDRYFGKVPSERLIVTDDALLFKCDGNHRSKIGVGPARARPFSGSYSAASQLLTLVHYDRPAGADSYVNSMWETQKEPFGGDVVNSYNDGPVEPGKPALGGFYEIETSSPAMTAKPGAVQVHTHRTLHLMGEPHQLDAIARRALGIGLVELEELTSGK